MMQLTFKFTGHLLTGSGADHLATPRAQLG